MNGKRFCDKFINKNANRAAACIAMKYGLEAPPKAVERETAHQEAEGQRRRRKPSVSISRQHRSRKLMRRCAVSVLRGGRKAKVYAQICHRESC